MVLAVAIAVAPAPSLGGTPNRLVGVPSSLDVVSYYPSDAGWSEMWTDWQPTLLAANFQQIAALGANTVREIVQPSVIGYPQPSPVFLSRVRQFVDIASQNGLHVQLTLFDWWTSYADLAGAKTWARAILKPFAGDPRIAFVELQNEIPVTDAALTWARTMIPFVRGVLGGETPVTVSISGRDPTTRLAELVAGLRPVRPDFFDLHFYGGSGQAAYSIFRRAKQLVAPTPLWIGETGYSTSATVSGFPAVPLTASAQDAAQAHFLATVEWAAEANGLGAAGVWALDDFLPSGVPFWSGQNLPVEMNFGLYRTDGTPKVAAQAVKASFAGHPPVDLNGGFETTVEAADGTTVPAVWGPSGDGATVASDTSVHRHGNSSVCVTATGGVAGVGSLIASPSDGGVATGDRVEVVAWTRLSTPSALSQLALEWMSSAGKRVGTLHSDTLPSTGKQGWVRASVTATAPIGAAYALIHLTAQVTDGSVWFDDVTYSVRRAKAEA